MTLSYSNRGYDSAVGICWVCVANTRRAVRSGHTDTLYRPAQAAAERSAEGAEQLPKQSPPPPTGACPLPEDTRDVRRWGLPSTPMAEVLLETPPSPALLLSAGKSHRRCCPHVWLQEKPRQKSGKILVKLLSAGSP